jgi:hypothetical protein
LAREDPAKHIIDQRPQRVRRALEDRAQAHRVIGDIAWLGLLDPSPSAAASR